MLRTAAYQHYWTVRGRGFDPKQWRALLRVTNKIVENAKRDGLKISFEAQADKIRIVPDSGDGEPFSLFKDDGNAETYNAVRTDMQPYDAVVVSILTAAKKIAPDIIEVSSDGGADVFRRRYASVEEAMRQVVGFAPGQGAPGGAGDGGGGPPQGGPPQGGPPQGGGDVSFNIQDTSGSMEEAWQKAIKGERVWNPDTGNYVLINSLAPQYKAKYRKQFTEQWKEQAAKAKQRAKEHAEKTKKKTQEALEKAEQATGKGQSKGKKAMNEQMIREAAIRVAAETKNPQLKQAILYILAGKDLPPEFIKNIKKEDADGDGIIDEKSKKPWEKDKDEDKDKKASLRKAYEDTLEDLRKIAHRDVIAFYTDNPKSKVASASTALRVALADKMAKKWIQDAIKEPGRVRDYLGIPEGEDIPMGKLDGAIKKVKGSGNKSLLSALLLAKRLKGGLGKGKKKAKAA